MASGDRGWGRDGAEPHRVLTPDTSGILAALDVCDPHHTQAVVALRADGGPLNVAAGLTAEAAYMIEVLPGAIVLDAFLADLAECAFTHDYREDDISRVRALVARYRDLPPGYADAAVLACAERNGGRVLTLDLRHFADHLQEALALLLTPDVHSTG